MKRILVPNVKDEVRFIFKVPFLRKYNLSKNELFDQLIDVLLVTDLEFTWYDIAFPYLRSATANELSFEWLLNGLCKLVSYRTAKVYPVSCFIRITMILGIYIRLVLKFAKYFISFQEN